MSSLTLSRVLRCCIKMRIATWILFGFVCLELFSLLLTFPRLLPWSTLGSMLLARMGTFAAWIPSLSDNPHYSGSLMWDACSQHGLMLLNFTSPYNQLPTFMRGVTQSVLDLAFISAGTRMESFDPVFTVHDFSDVSDHALIELLLVWPSKICSPLLYIRNCYIGVFPVMKETVMGILTSSLKTFLP